MNYDLIVLFTQEMTITSEFAKGNKDNSLFNAKALFTENCQYVVNRIIRNQDLTALAANVSNCRGCDLCQE